MTVRIKGIPARRISLMLRAFYRVTFIAGLCLVLWPCFVMAESRWVQYVGAWQLAAAARDQQETIVPPKPSGSASRSPLQRGRVLGQFEVPRLKLSYVLLEGTDNRTLDKSIGHVEGTGLPGESGNISIAGHRNTHFRKLEWIRRGDEIVITSPRGHYRYIVEWLRLFRSNDIGVIDAGHGPAVTLITCFPFEYVGSAPLRYIVRALPDDETRRRLSPMSSNATQSGQ
jgi:sortase A